MGEFDSSKVTPAVLKRAKAILDKYDLESIQIASAGAAVFYQWVNLHTLLCLFQSGHIKDACMIYGRYILDKKKRKAYSNISPFPCK